MALLPIDRSSVPGSFALDFLVSFSGDQGSISTVAKVDGVVWVLNHFIAFVKDDTQIDGVPEWAFDRKIKLMNDILRRGTIDTDHWILAKTPVHMGYRELWEPDMDRV